jgi:hypothetical protein
MSAVSTLPLSRSRSLRASTTSQLPHWAEVTDPRPRGRPTPAVAAVLGDLVSWAADIAVCSLVGAPRMSPLSSESAPTRMRGWRATRAVISR